MSETHTKLPQPNRWSRCLLVALLVPFTFACTGISIFLSNSTEWGGDLPVLVPLIAGWLMAGTAIIFLIQIPFLYLKKSWFTLVNVFLFGIGFLLWLQANVFNWNFGQLDGSGIDWNNFRSLMIFEIIIYAAVILFIFLKRNWLFKYVPHFSCLLMMMQTIPLLGDIHMAWKHSGSWKRYEATYKGFFDYSKEQNVVLIIPDAFSSQLFRKLAEKHPEILDWFADFNSFQNQKSQGSTRTTIPQMFTACEAGTHRTTRAATLWNSEGTLLKTLTESGFWTRIYTWAQTRYHWDHQWISNIRLKDSTEGKETQRTRWNDWADAQAGSITDFAIIRSLPILFKPANFETFHVIAPFFPLPSPATNSPYQPLRKTGSPFLAQIIDENPVTSNSEKPVFNVIHFCGAHAPYEFNEQFEHEVMQDIEGEERQGYAALLLIKRMIDDMKSADVYNHSIIIIAGDHGNYTPRLMTRIADRSQFHNPLLLIKRKEEQHHEMVYHHEYTNVQDMTPTIFDLLQVKNLPDRFSVFDVPESISQQRKEEYETFWDQKREETWNPKERNKPFVRLKKVEKPAEHSVEIALKRSELLIYHDKLCWYVGDNPDIWNQTYPVHDAQMIFSLKEESAAYYQVAVPLTMVGSEKESYYYWCSSGSIDTQDLANGEYEVACLIPKQDGTYAKSMLGAVTVESGKVSSVNESRE